MPIYLSDPKDAVIYALVFVLGLLIGAFLTAGGRRKWKARYRDETTRREAIEREHRDLSDRWDTREKEWSSQETAREAAIRENRRDPVVVDRRPTDIDGDGVRDSVDRRRDSDIDGDGVRDNVDRRPTDDRKA
ncbi:MAG: hypothetical protein ABIW03_06690 [Sphingomicrobium sp.]